MAEAKVKKVNMLTVSYDDKQPDLIEFKLSNGKAIVFDMTSVSDDIAYKAKRHGFNQKIRDAAAGYTASKDGKRAANPDGAFDEMMAVIDSLKAGSWDRKGGGGGVSYVRYLPAAIAKMKNITLERAELALKAISDEKRAELSKQPKVLAVIQEIIAEETRKKAEGDIDPLAGLEFGEEDDDDNEDENTDQ